MPLRELRAYMEMLPRVRAEAALRWVRVLAVGTGAMKAEASGDAIREWRRTVAPDLPVARARTREGHAAMVAGAGIGVRVVKVGR